jgi:Ca2+-binding EF-hand superfamily protein
MKTSIAILSALVLSVIMTRAEESDSSQKHKKPNPGERFAKVDTDGSGSISLVEFQSTPRGKKNPERAAEMFKKIDADSSSEISKDELMKFAAEHKGGHKARKRAEGGGGEAAAE